MAASPREHVGRFSSWHFLPVKTPIRLGYVGGGFMAQRVHLPNFATLPHCALVAVAERRPKLARAVASRFAVKEVYSGCQNSFPKGGRAKVVVGRRVPSPPADRAAGEEGIGVTGCRRVGVEEPWGSRFTPRQ